MSFSSSFLTPGNATSSPAANPLAPSSSATSNPPPLIQQPANALGPSSISSFPSIASAPTGSGSSAATMRLREIAQKSQKLNDTIQAGSPALPKLELSLGMIREKARDMSRRAGGAGRENMQQANFLLASSGLNPSETSKTISSLHLQAPMPSTQAVQPPAMDVQTFLSERRTQNILSAIEKGLQRTSNSFTAELARHRNTSWEALKRRTLEKHRGIVNGDFPERESVGPVGQFEAFGRSSVFGRTMDTSIQQSETSDSLLTLDLTSVHSLQRVDAMANVVRALNDSRMQSRRPNLIPALSDAILRQGGDSRSIQLADALKVITSQITDEDDEEVESVAPRAFRKDYIERKGLEKMNSKITDGSRRFLEGLAWGVVVSEVSQHPQEAQLGGIPSVVQRVRGFLNIRFKEGGKWHPDLTIVNDAPVWALIYFLIRTGHLIDAVRFLQTPAILSSFQTLEPSFPAYLKAYATSPNHALPRHLLDRLHVEFNQRIRYYKAEEDDPFKFALYKLLGRCDVQKRAMPPKVVATSEDYLWVQLVLAREDEASGDKWGLGDVAKGVVKAGRTAWDRSGQRPEGYFLVLILVGEYERAVHFLLNHSPSEGIHFAVVLAWYGLLRISTSSSVFEDDLLNLENAGNEEYPTFNFAKALALYAKNFIRASASSSFEYLSLITINSDLSAPTNKFQINAAQEAARELVVESRAFVTLLGDIRPDGTREPGIIEKKSKLLGIEEPAKREYIRSIVEKAATLVDDEGDTASAVLLYHLSEDYSLVLATINRRLSDVFLDPSAPIYANDPAAQEETKNMNFSMAAVADPASLASNVMSIYEANGNILQRLDSRERETCKVLLGMIEARKAFLAGRWEASISIIEELDLIPLSGSPSTLKRYAQNIPLLSDAVAKNISGLLVMVMQALVNISKQLREAVYADPSKERKLAEGRRKGGNIVIFAGLIQYRMGGEVYEMLTRLEGMI